MTESREAVTSVHEQTMYCVSSGSYSDYRVICVCESKERAEEVAAAMRADSDGWRRDATVEQIAYVDYKPELIPVYQMNAEIMDNGEVTESPLHQSNEFPFDSLYPFVRVSWRWVRAPMHHDKGGRLEVRGYDLEAVRHVYGDRKAQLQVEDAFRMTREAKGRA